MSNLVVYADESGNTGENLTGIDGRQRYFVHGSHCLNEEECIRVIDDLRKKFKVNKNSPELKIKSFYNTKTSEFKDGFLDYLFGNDGVLCGKVGVNVIHKDYFTCAKMISEISVERILAREGKDLEFCGENYGVDVGRLTGVLFDLINKHGLMVDFEPVLDGFNKLFVSNYLPSSAFGIDLSSHLCEFQSTFSIFYNKFRPHASSESIFLVLNHIAASGNEIKELMEESSSRYTLNPIYASVPSLIRFWNNKFKGKSFSFMHDRTNFYENNRSHKIEELVGFLKLTPEESCGLNPISIELERFEMVESKFSPGIQVADLIAGVVNIFFADLGKVQEKSNQVYFKNIFREVSPENILPLSDQKIFWEIISSS